MDPLKSWQRYFVQTPSVPFTIEKPWSLSCEGRAPSQHSRGKCHQGFLDTNLSSWLYPMYLIYIQSSICNIPAVNSTANNSILWLLCCCGVCHRVALSSGSERCTKVTSLTVYFIYPTFVYYRPCTRHYSKYFPIILTRLIFITIPWGVIPIWQMRLREGKKFAWWCTASTW